MGGFEENPLTLADRKVESADHGKGHFCFAETELSPGCSSEGGILGLEQRGIDSGVDDVELGGIEPAGGAVMPFGHRRGGVIVAME